MNLLLFPSRDHVCRLPSVCFSLPGGGGRCSELLLVLRWLRCCCCMGASLPTNSLLFVFLAFLFLLQGDSGMRTLHVVSIPSVFCVPLIWTWGVLGLSLFWHLFFVVVLVLCFPVCLAMLSQFRAYTCCFAPYVLTHSFFWVRTLLLATRLSLFPQLDKWQEAGHLQAYLSLALSIF